jgi:dynein heavy chain
LFFCKFIFLKVELQRYLKISMNETLPALMEKISVATQRVLFLLDCTLFPTEDIQLNTRVFQWPKDMASVFELAKTRTGHRRDQVILQTPNPSPPHLTSRNLYF